MTEKRREEDRPGNIRFYQAEIRAYKRTFENWQNRAHAIIKAYRDDDQQITKGSKRWGKSRFNLLWSNVQTLQPAIYARPPKLECERRYQDQDPIGRLAAEINERVGMYLAEDERIHQTLKRVRDDYLLPGRGTAWLRYSPKFGTEQVGTGDDGEPLFNVINESVAADFVLWEDFGHNVCRSWDEVRRVWRKIYVSKEDAVNRFGKDIAKKLKYTNTPKQYEGDKYAEENGSKAKRACVIELWDKDTKKAYWFEKDNEEEFLDEKLPYDLHEFFPCPKPFYATLTTDSLVPIPLFTYYKERAEDLDDLMQRRRALIRAIKVLGVHDASQPELSNIFKSDDLKLIPSKNWVHLQQSGGLRGVMDFIPIEQYTSALAVVNESIAQEKQFIYEISSISDTLRGYADPRRTATAEQIQGNFATLRLEDAQGEMQRFSRDLLSIMTEIAIENFSPEKIAEIVEAEQMGPEAQANFPAAVQLLKDDQQRTYRLTIQTDSTLALDKQKEKQTRIEALEAYGQAVQKMLPMMQQFPQLAPMFKEMFLFGVRTFPGGRQMEFSIEQSVDQYLATMQQQLAQQQEQGPPPDPNMMKVQAEQEARQAELQMEGQKMQMDSQSKAQEMQFKQQEAQQDAELERYKIDSEMAFQQYKLDAEMAFEREKFEAEMELKALELQLKATPQPSVVNGTQKNGVSGPIELNLNMSQAGKKKITVQKDPMTGNAVGLVEDIKEAPIE